MRDRPRNGTGPQIDVAGAECDCPADPQIARFFDRRSRTRRTAGSRYEMGGVSQALLAKLLEVGPAGRTVLELGCGPGAMLEELLLGGATGGTGLDLSAEVIDEARARAEAAGLAERVTFDVADGARAPLEEHDWVVLDKVMCCYPDIARLLAHSIPAARRLYALAVPASYGWRGAIARVAIWLDELVSRVSRRPCPGYVHDLTMIERALGEAGFRETARTTSSLAWHIAVFERAAGAAAG